MFNERSNEAEYVLIGDVWHVERHARPRSRFEIDEEIADPWSYRAKRGQGTIRLTAVEYRILRFLASRPNRAFSGSRIAQAVSTGGHAISVESLNRHIRSLRGRLGFYSDYIQSVPYIGYRFKA
jgi:DNA-binding response OmpR family regulator